MHKTVTYCCVQKTGKLRKLKFFYSIANISWSGIHNCVSSTSDISLPVNFFIIPFLEHLTYFFIQDCKVDFSLNEQFETLILNRL